MFIDGIVQVFKLMLQIIEAKEMIYNDTDEAYSYIYQAVFM